jgi:hypothetical protein
MYVRRLRRTGCKTHAKSSKTHAKGSKSFAEGGASKKLRFYLPCSRRKIDRREILAPDSRETRLMLDFGHT